MSQKTSRSAIPRITSRIIVPVPIGPHLQPNDCWFGLQEDVWNKTCYMESYRGTAFSSTRHLRMPPERSATPFRPRDGVYRWNLGGARVKEAHCCAPSHSEQCVRLSPYTAQASHSRLR